MDRGEERSEKLIAEFQQGRLEAFAELVEAHQERVYSFALRMCRNVEDARDILQDTFLNALRSLKQFRGESRLSTWLFRIAANACARHHRKGTFAPSRELSLEQGLLSEDGTLGTTDVPDWSQNPELLSLQGEMADQVEAALDRLPREYKAVLLLRDLERFSTEEVAEILGISGGAVKSRLHRARLLLRRVLTNYFSEGRGIPVPLPPFRLSAEVKRELRGLIDPRCTPDPRL